MTEDKKALNGHPRFYELLEKIADTHSRKNSDYAKSNDPLSNLKMSEDIGIPAWIGNYNRLGDKWSRYTQLTRKRIKGVGPSVKDESIKDTLEDLAVYCLLEIILLEEDEKTSKKDSL